LCQHHPTTAPTKTTTAEDFGNGFPGTVGKVARGDFELGAVPMNKRGTCEK